MLMPRGRPPGSGTKQTGRSAAGKAKKPEPKIERTYVCCRCTREFTKQLGNFSKTRSPMWAGNDGYLPICNHCTQELYEHYCDVFQSKEAALKRLCMKLDVFWSESVYKMMLGGAVRDNPFKEYVSKSNLIQVKGTSYDDTLDNEAIENGNLILSEKDIQKAIEEGDVEISAADIEKWGTGYSPEEYAVLNRHYVELTQNEKKLDFLKEKSVRDLCMIHVQSKRVLAKGDNKGYSDLLQLYQKTAAWAHLKIAGDIDTTGDTWGKWLADIEEYTPAEYYADKNAYRDFFGIGEYLKRFIFRPLKNWVTGSKEKDKEFNIDGET